MFRRIHFIKTWLTLSISLRLHVKRRPTQPLLGPQRLSLVAKITGQLVGWLKWLIRLSVFLPIVPQAIRASVHFLVEHYFVLWDAIEPDKQPCRKVFFLPFSRRKSCPGHPGGSQKCKKLPGSDPASDSGPCVCEACIILGFIFV